MIRLTRLSYPTLVLISALVLCVTAAAQTPEPKSKATGSVSGRVTVGDKPAPGLSITASSPDLSIITAQATTDADGRYRLNGLGAGQVSITPVAPLYVIPNSPTSGSSKILTLSAGESAEGIDFKISRGGVVTGRVMDADSRPLIEERVTLMQVDENGAPAREQFGRFQNYQMYVTDDRGIYRIYGLPAGHYKVSVGFETGTVTGMRPSGYYQKTYYPDATDSAKATIVDLNEGGEAKDINITIGRRSVTYAVSGRIVDGDTGTPLPGISFGFGVVQKKQNQSYIAGTMSPGTPTNSLGEFRLEGIEPGHYAVFISKRFDFNSETNPAAGLISEPVLFDVVDSDVTNLEVKAKKGQSVSGVVVADGIADRKVLARISSLKIGASVQPAPGALRVIPMGTSVSVNPDGSFQINGLRPGKVFIYLLGPGGTDPKGFSINRIEREGVPQNMGFDLPPGENLSGIRILMGYGSGIIRGQVKFEGGALPADSTMYISMTRDGIPTQRGSVQVDSRGQFLVENLPAGAYELTLQLISFGGSWPRGFPSRLQQTVNVTDGADSQVVFTVDLGKKEGP
jgi:protocatechuate 3,4-dioxygenase beta subunit